MNSVGAIFYCGVLPTWLGVAIYFIGVRVARCWMAHGHAVIEDFRTFDRGTFGSGAVPEVDLVTLPSAAMVPLGTAPSKP